MNFSFQKLFYAIATIFALFAILILGRTILIPIGFALLISFILLPLANRFEKWGLNSIFSAFFSIFSVLLIIAGGIFLFSTQIVDISSEFTDFQEKILQVFADVTLFINSNMNFVPHIEKGELMVQLKNWAGNSAGSLVQKTFTSTASFFTGFLVTIIFTFLILIYRTGLTNAFISSYSKEKKDKVLIMFKSVQQVGKKYLFGMMMMILILGLANSIGLLIIGIDNPFLFGFLAGFLAIIPYVGTFIGAAIPILYAFITYDSPWMAVAVAILFWFVQLIESNFLSPKIVGDSLRINALAAILSIIVGASVWGIAGMILFLPFTAMLKVVCEQYEELKPIALLLGEHNKRKVNDGSEIISKLKKEIVNKISKKK